MISKKEKALHIYSVFGLVLVLTVFFILGGGTSATASYSSKPSDLNVSVPDASVDALASSRFVAERREAQKSNDARRVENLQKNSFAFINKPQKDSTNCSPKTSSSSSGKKEFVVINNTGGGKSSDNKNRKKIKKSEVMRRKREQLEKELGVKLFDGGLEADVATESPVQSAENPEVLALNSEISSESGFYGLEGEDNSFPGDIKAVVHGDHIDKKSGSIIKMRLLEDADIDGVCVPKNTFVYGKLSFKSGRGMILVQNINYRNRILRFPASIYDTDGFEGIYLPDNIVSDTKDKSVSSAIGSVNVDVSTGSKAANSAISAVSNAIKSAVQGSIRESKISISSNYHITIKKKK